MPRKAGKGYSGSLYNMYHRKRSNDNKDKKERCEHDTNESETDLSDEPTGMFKILLFVSLSVQYSPNRS